MFGYSLQMGDVICVISLEFLGSTELKTFKFNTKNLNP
jgi:hypothetical protein